MRWERDGQGAGGQLGLVRLWDSAHVSVALFMTLIMDAITKSFGWESAIPYYTTIIKGRLDLLGSDLSFKKIWFLSFKKIWPPNLKITENNWSDHVKVKSLSCLLACIFNIKFYSVLYVQHLGIILHMQHVFTLWKGCRIFQSLIRR